jgi:predicted TIM-barrel fold metal-dependent hydrolase
MKAIVRQAFLLSVVVSLSVVTWVLSIVDVHADERKPAIGDAIDNVPIFDAHMHYKEPAWQPFPVQTVIELMDKSGVAMALVSSSPDDGTIMLWEYAPKRIVPELRPYHGQIGASNWTKAPGMLAYVEKRLKTYPHQGIGEFHIHALDPHDHDFLKQVARLAAERRILIHIHSDAKPVRLFYEFEPGLTIIWAHAGMSEPPEVIGPMLERYPTLFADTSYRESDILGDGDIDPRWRDLLMRYPDRFMVGSDTWVNSQWEHYQALIAMNRRWLSKFPRHVAEKIAYQNAEALFGRKVSRQLIGKK